MDKSELKSQIEALIGDYCDATWNGLKRAHFIEYFGDDGTRGPQELADRLVELFERKENQMSELACPDCGEELVKGQLELEDGDWLVVWLCGCEAEGPGEEEA